MELSILYLSRFFTVIAVFIGTSSARPVSDATSQFLAALFSDEHPQVRQTRSGYRPDVRKLYSASGYNLEVTYTGMPIGGRHDRSFGALFEIEVPMIGFMSFRNVATGRYLRIRSNGDVDTTEECPIGCVDMPCCFKHTVLPNFFHVFSSADYPTKDPEIYGANVETLREGERREPQFHLAINKSGEVRTTLSRNKRMSHFLLRSID